MPENRYSPKRIAQFAEEAKRDGLCILRGHFPKEKLRRWRDRFRPLLDEHIRRQGQLKNRGPQRYYVTLPFDEDFADEGIFADPDILSIVEKLVGEDFVMCQLATDTPLKGSAYQDIHRDAPPLFPRNQAGDAGFSAGGEFSSG